MLTEKSSEGVSPTKFFFKRFSLSNKSDRSLVASNDSSNEGELRNFMAAKKKRLESADPLKRARSKAKKKALVKNNLQGIKDYQIAAAASGVTLAPTQSTAPGSSKYHLETVSATSG